MPAKHKNLFMCVLPLLWLSLFPDVCSSLTDSSFLTLPHQSPFRKSVVVCSQCRNPASKPQTDSNSRGRWWLESANLSARVKQQDVTWTWPSPLLVFSSLLHLPSSFISSHSDPELGESASIGSFSDSLQQRTRRSLICCFFSFIIRGVLTFDFADLHISSLIIILLPLLLTAAVVAVLRNNPGLTAVQIISLIHNSLQLVSFFYNRL